MNKEEVKKNYPNSFSLLLAPMRDSLEKFQKSIAGEGNDVTFPEIKDEYLEAGAQSLLSVNQRVLYDFFDKNNVYCSINKPHVKDSQFEYSVYSNSLNTGIKGKENNRMLIEEVVFTNAFMLLEKQLNGK